MHISKSQEKNAPNGPQDWVIKKNYYVTYLLLKDSSTVRQLAASKPIARLLEKRFERFKNSANCRDLTCYLDAFKWQGAEIEQLVNQFAEQIAQNKNLEKLVQSSLMPSIPMVCYRMKLQLAISKKL